MAVSRQQVYILLNDRIKVVDSDTFEVVKTISPETSGAVSIAVSSSGKPMALVSLRL
jgi:hypothetical protein